MIFKTKRLILRPWCAEDAESLFEYAKDPLVGPIAGWPVHTDVENSRSIIESVLSDQGTYAVCLKDDNVAIGSIGLMTSEKSNIEMGENEVEIGFWIGVPFWGQGLIPEAVRVMLRHAFVDLGMHQVWSGYFDGNDKSKRAQEKCGFLYQYTLKDIEWKLLDTTVTEHITLLTRERWEEMNNEN